MSPSFLPRILAIRDYYVHDRNESTQYGICKAETTIYSIRLVNSDGWPRSLAFGDRGYTNVITPGVEYYPHRVTAGTAAASTPDHNLHHAIRKGAGRFVPDQDKVGSSLQDCGARFRRGTYPPPTHAPSPKGTASAGQPPEAQGPPPPLPRPAIWETGGLARAQGEGATPPPPPGCRQGLRASGRVSRPSSARAGSGRKRSATPHPPSLVPLFGTSGLARAQGERAAPPPQGVGKGSGHPEGPRAGGTPPPPYRHLGQPADPPDAGKAAPPPPHPPMEPWAIFSFYSPLAHGPQLDLDASRPLAIGDRGMP
jgi:hypothetical protein